MLVGHSGAGKTTLVEALLARPGTIQRAGRVEDGTTVSDFDEVEVRQQRSVNLTLAPLMHAGVKVNLLDTPGYADFTGDLRAGLRAADAALFIVSAADGVDGLTTDALGGVRRRRHAARRRHHQARPPAGRLRRGAGRLPAPRSATRSCRSTCRSHDDEGGVARPARAAVRSASTTTPAARRTSATPKPADADRMAEARNALIEAIIQESEDESLMDRYLSGEEIDAKVLIEDLEKAVARGSFYPVLAAAALQGIGLAEMLEVMTQAFPSPRSTRCPP